MPFFCWFLSGSALTTPAGELQQLLEPVVRGLGLQLWGLEYHQGSRRGLLRLYIDSEAGVTVDDCAAVSRQVGRVLDVEDPIRGEYVLEVSSPGVERRLYTMEQFSRYIGSMVRVQLRYPFEGRKKFSGQLVNVEGDDIVLNVDEHEYLFPVASLGKAQVIVQPSPDGKGDKA